MTHARSLAIAVGLMIAAGSTSLAAQCGDCNGDGLAGNVLDALSAMRVSVGLDTPTPAQIDNCDVDSDLAIGMVDALLMAQNGVGLVAVFTCPNDPPQAVNCSAPAFADFFAIIDYDLIDSESDTCSVMVEWSTNGGVTFSPATSGMGGSGVSGLASSPTGVAHTFDWEIFFDLMGACQVQAILRVTASDAGGVGSSCTTGVIDVCTIP